MPVEHQISSDDIVVIRVLGRLGRQEALESLRAIWSDPQFEAGTRQLLDLRELESLGLEMRDFLDIVEEVQKNPAAMSSGAIAVVTSGDLMFGLMRMFEQLASILPAPIRVFRDDHDAMCWLNETAAAGDRPS